jgi:DNA adenine methylase
MTTPHATVDRTDPSQLAAPPAPARAPKPFVKWAGGKRQLIGRLAELYPAEFGRFHEPFVGGGAVFFDLAVRAGSLAGRAVLSDTNRELIDCYRAIQTSVEALIDALGRHVYERDYYYEQRARDPATLDLIERAARMIYLNRTGFNGLYRVNSKGEFNVPFGRHKNPRICNAENLRACAAALRDVELHAGGFEEVEERAAPGDFVYFDPPYIPLSETANFTKYQRHGFGMENQERLAEVFDVLAGRGVRVMLSNSDVPWMHDRYRDHQIHVLAARRAVNSNGARRGPVGEVVVVAG